MILNGVVAVGHNDDTDSDSDARREPKLLGATSDST